MTEAAHLADLQKPKRKRGMKELQALPPKKRIAAFLEDNKKTIQAAMPKHLSGDRMLQVSQTAVTQNPQLLECDTATLFGALIKCTQLGLEPNNALGQIYLIPFKNRKANRVDCQVIMGYKGMIDLARRSGNIVSIQAMAVREGDEFSYEYGINEHLTHRPGMERGEITHFYAYAKLVGGGFQFDVFPKSDIDKLMKQTQSRGEYGPWKDHYEQMGRKTMVRRLFNYLPVSIEAQKAAALDATGETQAQELDHVLTDVDYTVVPERDEWSGEEYHAAEEAPEQPAAPLVDVNGEVFDPEIHLQTASGKPMYNADDSFRRRPHRGKEHKPEPEPEKPAKAQKAAQPKEPPPEATPAATEEIEPPWEDEPGEDMDLE